MPYVYKEVEVDINLDDFDTEDLLEELESRGSLPTQAGDSKEILETIWRKRREGRDYQQELDRLIWAVLGKVI